MVLKKLHQDRRGQAFVEALFVIPLLFMIFIFILEMGFLMYNWAVINFYTATTSVTAATQGQFTNQIRLDLALKINDWTINSQRYSYDVSGTVPPAEPAEDTVYIYGTDRDTQVQRGTNITVGINYPWHFNFFVVDNLARFVVEEKNIRIKTRAVLPSEVYFE